MQLQQHIFFIGFMGSGKSYHARRIAQMRGDEELFLDLDLLIAEEAGMSIPDIFAQLGERAFRALEQEALIKVIEQPPRIIACGGGCPCWYDNMQRIKAAGLSIFLHPPVSVLHQRLLPEKAQRPLLAQVREVDFENFIEKLLQERLFYYLQADLIWRGALNTK